MKTYEIGDTIIFKLDNVYQVGIVTAVNVSKKTRTTYDIRSEKGSGYIYVPVDKPINEYLNTFAVIDSVLTEKLKDKVSNRMHVDKNIGHTRANFNKELDLHIDGTHKNSLFIQQYEKYNNFVFPCIGPRSW